MGGPRRKRWLFVAVALAILAFLYLATARNGLYNNGRSAASALDDHDAAWRQMNWGREFSRLSMQAVIRRFDGRCITGEAEWEAVPLDQRLDSFLGRPGLLIECHVTTRGAWPHDVLNLYRWTTVLEPIGPDRLRLRETRRQNGTEIVRRPAQDLPATPGSAR